MKLILATSNKGKVREIKEIFKDYEVIAYTELIEGFEIIEDAPTFKGNAIIKAKAVYEALQDENVTVISDDSGISVPALDGAPGIYSARYAGVGASDKDNLNKLIASLKENNLEKTPAFYTCAIALVNRFGVKCVHGWMHGDAIAQAKGEKGFGYDPMFVPEGHEKTLGELEDSIKEKISHRYKALKHLRNLL